MKKNLAFIARSFLDSMSIRNRLLVSSLVTSLLLLAMYSTVLGESESNSQTADNNLNYLFAGFAIVWIGIIGYLLYLVSRLKVLKEELDELRREIESSKASNEK